ncbi:uncharacterized protein K460DRAFT_184843 [Cucurbitaria berberidis CBS 394.84]|uniref:Uncharacterized protein n=1 Tax=Cucurbitaria berberidis CBS 394.84 TaxID=1168544 RepID=A0A9P4GBB9_9PLEO|nr:uncharacterized protein K460DRAFT_184843 [Cucurbitaria berberidis CBS 394.84]KAF1842416.1 hypothetical protein K460DRAFT_184843 [Cucurbitaria berberidis CBS 394.84]
MTEPLHHNPSTKYHVALTHLAPTTHASSTNPPLVPLYALEIGVRHARRPCSHRRITSRKARHFDAFHASQGSHARRSSMCHLSTVLRSRHLGRRMQERKKSAGVCASWSSRQKAHRSVNRLLYRSRCSRGKLCMSCTSFAPVVYFLSVTLRAYPGAALRRPRTLGCGRPPRARATFLSLAFRRAPGRRKQDQS